MLVLCIGDLFIPHRAPDLDAKFKKLLVPGKIQKILATGNLCCPETLDYLRTICPDIQATAGCWDQLKLKDSLQLEIEGFKFGLLSGSEVVPAGDRASLMSVANRMDVDVLVSGHTCSFEAVEHQGKFFVNPGSAVGADHPAFIKTPPSFVLMDVRQALIVLYIYRLVNDQVKVEKMEWKKAI